MPQIGAHVQTSHSQGMRETSARFDSVSMKILLEVSSEFKL